jgi:hypothetical protein
MLRILSKGLRPATAKGAGAEVAATGQHQAIHPRQQNLGLAFAWGKKNRDPSGSTNGIHIAAWRYKVSLVIAVAGGNADERSI